MQTKEKEQSAREYARQQAWLRIEEAGGKELLNQKLTPARIAAIACTTQFYVKSWIKMVNNS